MAGKYVPTAGELIAAGVEAERALRAYVDILETGGYRTGPLGPGTTTLEDVADRIGEQVEGRIEQIRKNTKKEDDGRR